MVEKLTTFIFRSEITYDELINVIYFIFVFRSAFIFHKIAKTVKDADGHKMADFSAPSNNTRTSLPKTAKENLNTLVLKIWIFVQEALAN